jgi:hypothetical protein
LNKRKSILTTKPQSAPPRLLTDTTEGLHPSFAKEYDRTFVPHEALDDAYFARFEREIEELQEDFALLDACDGDFDKFRAELSTMIDRDVITDPGMVAALEKCMLEEDQLFSKNPCSEIALPGTYWEPIEMKFPEAVTREMDAYLMLGFGFGHAFGADYNWNPYGHLPKDTLVFDDGSELTISST